MTWPSVKVHHAVNYSMGELGLNKTADIALTTLAACAPTSRSEGRESRVTLRQATKVQDSKDMSRRHSTDRTRKMEIVMSRYLVKKYKIFKKTFEGPEDICSSSEICMILRPVAC